MANPLQHIGAFFSKDYAVNSDGQLVHADGFFDSGDNGNIPLTDEELRYLGRPDLEFLDSLQQQDSNSFIGPPVPDVLFDDEFSEDLYNRIIESAEAQNQAAQSSADRAMDFSREMFQLESDYNSAEAAMNRDFQRELFNENWQRYISARGSEYQTAMEDMKKAGLNPKLVAQLGGASTSMPSTPGGAQASASAPSGISANMVQAQVSSLAGVLSTYISGADALDRQQNDFVKDSIQNIFDIVRLLAFVGSRGSSMYLPF